MPSLENWGSRLKSLLCTMHTHSHTLLSNPCPFSLVLKWPASLTADTLPTLSHLLAHQSIVREVIEREWLPRYIAASLTLTAEEVATKKKEEESGECEEMLIKKAKICVEHTVSQSR